MALAARSPHTAHGAEELVLGSPPPPAATVIPARGWHGAQACTHAPHHPPGPRRPSELPSPTWLLGLRFGYTLTGST